MKKLLLLLLFIPIIVISQPSIIIGLNSRLHAFGQIAYEKNIWPINLELSAKSTTESLLPTIGLQAGFTSDNYCDNRQFRLSIGTFYHIDDLVVYKVDQNNIPIIKSKFKLGGSVRWYVNNGIFNILYDGQTISLGVGYIFNKKMIKLWKNN